MPIDLAHNSCYAPSYGRIAMAAKYSWDFPFKIVDLLKLGFSILYRRKPFLFTSNFLVRAEKSRNATLH